MEWFWFIVAAAGGAGFAVKWWRDRQATRRTKAEELESVRRLVGEDVAYLHEQLQRLDREIGAQVLDEETRVAHQTALDSFEAARRTLEQISTAEEVSKVTETLAAGLYALACAQARLTGRPLPEQQVVCFFNPLHGPSVTEVLWTRTGHGARRVPACSTDADRVTNNVMPEARTVSIGARTMPYWAAGSAFLPTRRATSQAWRHSRGRSSRRPSRRHPRPADTRARHRRQQWPLRRWRLRWEWRLLTLRRARSMRQPERSPATQARKP